VATNGGFFRNDVDRARFLAQLAESKELYSVGEHSEVSPVFGIVTVV